MSEAAAHEAEDPQTSDVAELNARLSERVSAAQQRMRRAVLVGKTDPS